MKILKRFRLYLVGVLIGSLMVAVLFRDKVHLFTAWLPENRVIQEITDKKIQPSPLASCQLKCLNLPFEVLRSHLSTQTSVEFSQSQTKGNPRTYLLIQDLKSQKIQLSVVVGDSSAVLSKIDWTGKNGCNCP